MSSVGQVRADMLQDKLDALNFNKKKRPRPTPSFDDLTEQLTTLTQQLPYGMRPVSVFEDDFDTQRGKAAGMLFTALFTLSWAPGTGFAILM